MAYQMATMPVTLNDLKGHSQVAGPVKCNSVAGLLKFNPSDICAVVYTILTDSVLAVPLRYLCFLYESGDCR